MVKVMVKVKYPPHITEDFIKFYLTGKAPKYPDYVKRLYQWVYSDFDNKVINIYEIPDEKLVEGLKGIAKRFTTYTTFKGYKYKIILLADASDAIELYKK